MERLLFLLLWIVFPQVSHSLPFNVSKAVTCGPIHDELIYGGEPTDKCQYSFTMYIEAFDDYSDNREPINTCSGILLSPKHILTAAHCTPGAKMFKVYAGLYDKYNKYDDNVQMLKAFKVKKHPRLDVAVLELDYTLIITDAVRIALVYRYDYMMWNAPTTVAVGYGFMGYVNGRYVRSQYRRYAATPLMSNEECNRKRQAADDEPISGDEVCTGWKRGGPMVGDSGGPLVWNLYPVAINWGGSGKKPEDTMNQDVYPATYVRLSPICDWMTKATNHRFNCIGA